jgi:cytochrome c biogenesis protein CcdA
MLTIASPCILPVLPFVFTGVDRRFSRSGLRLLVGMTLTFVAVATLASVGGSWAVHLNEYGRFAAILLLTLFGLTLLFGSLADHVMRPLVAVGNRLSGLAGAHKGIGASLSLGCATGLLWAPCAGPVLGLILTGAAIKGATMSTTVLLVAYAAGAATSLAAVLLIGGRLFAAMKKSLGIGPWVRRGVGPAVLLGVE